MRKGGDSTASEMSTRDTRSSGRHRAGWRQDKLENILPLKYGKARSAQFGYPRPGTPTFGSNGSFGSYERALTTKPSIIVGRKGAAGAVHYSPDPCWPIDTAYYTEGSDGAHLPFFRYLLESLQLVRLDRSTAIPSLSRDDYNGRVIHFPVSVEEQRRVVAEIEKQLTRLDAGVAALRRVQANLTRYRASALTAACEGRLVPTEAELAKMGGRKAKFETGGELLARILNDRRKQWSGRGNYKEPPAPEPPADVDLPAGWVWTGFEQLAAGTKHAIKAGPFGSSLKKSYYTQNGFKIYGQEQVIKGDPAFGDYFIPRGLFERLESCAVKSGDLLISLVGTSGKVLILPDDCAPGIINPRLVKMSLNRSGINPKFIKIVLESATARAFFKLAAHGGTMEILNLGMLKSFAIPLPPLAEQTRIVAEVDRRLSVVEELETVVSANLQRAARLRQSILQKALSGQLL